MEVFMKVKVDPNKCIGCGLCVGECDQVFDFNDDNISQVILSPVPKDLEEAVTEIIENCPTNAIEKEK